MKSSLLLALTGLSATFAVPLEKKADYAIKDKHFVPAQWKRVKRAEREHTIDLRIGLKQGNFEELERKLLEVSDPAHHLYGQHLSPAEVAALVAPSQYALGAVHDWLEDNNVRLDQIQYSPAKDWVMIVLPVSHVEDLLDTEYHVYENAAGSRVVRAIEYSLPRSLHEHIDTIQPTNYFSDPKAMAASPFEFDHQKRSGFDIDLSLSVDVEPESVPSGFDNDAAAVCNMSAVTSLCLRTLYNTVDYVPQVPELNSVATTNYLNESSNLTDFHNYMSLYRTDADSDYQFDVEIVADGINFQQLETTYFGKRDGEGNLDVQMVGGIVYPTNYTVYSTGGSPPFTPDLHVPTNNNEPYLTWLNYILAEPTVPLVISTSYGDDEQTVPESYARRVCAEFAALGARGVTLLFSSGDNGVGPNGTCFSNDGQNTPTFLPAFPASCPYVTAVGATMSINPEVLAWGAKGKYVGGGGVSNYFPQPSYQSAAVNGYLASIGNLHEGLYNASGRAYPDVAAQGWNLRVIYAGYQIRMYGTSASSPITAGVLTLVNDALLAAGRPPLGFINPLLYSYLGDRGFNDITIGNNWGCNTSGFPATEGWDLATGFGTPDFKKIREALLV